jgi:hypothetical protein
MATDKLRFVLLCDSGAIPSWQAKCLTETTSSDAALLVGVVKRAQPSPVVKKQKWQKRWKERRLIAWRLYNRFYVNRVAKATSPTDVGEILSTAPTFSYLSDLSSAQNEALSCEVISFIKSKKPDFVLRFSSGILSGEILTCAPFGVWSYHHGDPAKFRGQPPGFWEIAQKSPVAGAVLQVLNENLDAGHILHRGYFKTTLHSYAKTRDTMYFGASTWVRRACADIISNGFRSGIETKSFAIGPIYKQPTNLQVLRFLFSSAKEMFQSFVTYKLHRQNWNCAVIDAPIHVVAGLSSTEDQQSALKKADWMPVVKGTFRADPFGYITNNTNTIDGMHIFFENYDWSREIGSIAGVDYKGGCFSPLQSFLDARTHLSYPFVMHDSGHSYYIPENSAGRSICAYRLHSSGTSDNEAILIQKSELIDATFLRKDGLLWMFALDEVNSSNTDLHVYFSEDLTGPWHAHPMNPVKSDVRSARPGGTPFWFQGRLFRPAQDCSTHYGSSAVINEVKVLTVRDYKEEAVSRVSPLKNGPYPYGLHTVSSVGNRTLIDGARKVSVFSRALKGDP